jgi:hypothetical protein
MMKFKVNFNLSSRLWSRNGKPEKCFNSLKAWRIESLGQANDDWQSQPQIDADNTSHLSDGSGYFSFKRTTELFCII